MTSHKFYILCTCLTVLFYSETLYAFDCKDAFSSFSEMIKRAIGNYSTEQSNQITKRFFGKRQKRWRELDIRADRLNDEVDLHNRVLYWTGYEGYVPYDTIATAFYFHTGTKFASGAWRRRDTLRAAAYKAQTKIANAKFKESEGRLEPEEVKEIRNKALIPLKKLAIESEKRALSARIETIEALLEQKPPEDQAMKNKLEFHIEKLRERIRELASIVL